nr:hypothetical protein MarFTME_246 [Marseillevirus futianmevirus]
MKECCPFFANKRYFISKKISKASRPKTEKAFSIMLVCISQPLELSQLAALVVVQSGKIPSFPLDELSRDRIEEALKFSSSPFVLYRGAGKNREFYLREFQGIIFSLGRIYTKIKKEAHKTHISESLLLGLPTIDRVKEFPRETKDTLFELFLFWDMLPIESVPESFFDAICR